MNFAWLEIIFWARIRIWNNLASTLSVWQTFHRHTLEYFLTCFSEFDFLMRFCILPEDFHSKNGRTDVRTLPTPYLGYAPYTPAFCPRILSFWHKSLAFSEYFDDIYSPSEIIKDIIFVIQMAFNLSWENSNFATANGLMTKFGGYGCM